VGEVGYDRPQDFEEINLRKIPAAKWRPRCMGPKTSETFGGDWPITNAVPLSFTWVAWVPRGANACRGGGRVYRKNTGQVWPSAWRIKNGNVLTQTGSGKIYRFAGRSIRNKGAAPKASPSGPGVRGTALDWKMGATGALFHGGILGWFNGSPMNRSPGIIYVGKP